MRLTRNKMLVLTVSVICGILFLTGCASKTPASKSAKEKVNSAVSNVFGKKPPDNVPTDLSWAGNLPETKTSQQQSAPRPLRPQQASQDSKEGAQAAVDHFINSYGYALQTGDLQALEEASAPTCATCDALITDLKKTYQGVEIASLPIVTSLSTNVFAPQKGQVPWAAIYKVKIDSVTLKDRTTGNNRIYPAGEYTFGIAIEKNNSGLQVSSFDVIGKP